MNDIVCFPISGLHGLSRYLIAVLLVLTPLVVGLLTIKGYAQTALQFQGG